MTFISKTMFIMIPVVILLRNSYGCDCSIDLGWRDLPFRENIKPVLVVASLGHALSVFVNGKYFGKLCCVVHRKKKKKN